ncbi:MAG: DNA repair protein RadA [Alphaproteobacteria bacterium RIFCSPHIGHO2_01_FULL_41_14]|nr:MAG: DNA repair protein RadA [Alphaproteobacteria bacterium GWA1_45_9]OFW89770.1 MAG: DNA repair protein RadA [Alphaproteobacteria bacterium RIFCSPHIGHO2_01_FULL_41_14]
MSKISTLYVCNACGTQHPKWVGRCPDCGGWNSLHEEAISSVPKGLKRDLSTRPLEFHKLKGETSPPPRYITGIEEFDRVCGGGLVPGSVLLVGGDPGIGKSTLLLQVVAMLSQNHQCAYISGEEGLDQIRLRAERLKVDESPMHLASDTDLRRIIAALETKDPPRVAIIDSIQTMYLDTLESAPGTVAQVRTCAQELIRVAKKSNIILVLVGHVTKEGNIAGPRVLEHMVDTVLYFEGDRGHQFRIMRSVKNRFGPTDEIGVFEMTNLGLQQIENPSAAFISHDREGINGSCIFAGIEGTRPLLVEIQSLVAPSSLGTPRRTVIGWDSGRLAMVMAVLEARCGVSFAGKDVYLNVAGGLRILEPAADLAVAASLLSSLSGEPILEDYVVFGEIGLSGEIRPVGQIASRLKEAEKLGFKGAIMPKQNKKEDLSSSKKFALKELKTLGEIFALVSYQQPSPKEKEHHGVY